jgi:signal transduction histidine kinase
MQRLHDLIRGAIGRTRQMSVGLSPPVLEGEGLAEALGWLATQFETDHDLVVDVEVGGRIPVPLPEMRVLLFRTVRELLLHALQESRPDRLKVRLAEDGDDFLVEVDAPARAFREGPDAEANATFEESIERLGLFDATLRMGSTPGGGSRATVRVPLRIVRSEAPPDASLA